MRDILARLLVKRPTTISAPYRRYIAFSELVEVSDEVASALQRSSGAVVALESAVITHGLPYSTNLQTARRLESIVRENGAVPATVAMLDGKVKVGLTTGELERLAEPNTPAVKVSTRDIPNALAEARLGGTTVAATAWVAARLGIRVFATGGIGGAHRGASETFDISADLIELGRSKVAVVCAGAKSILDVAATLEVLETNGVNVVVYSDEDYFPGFFSSRTAYRAPHCTTCLREIADILRVHDQMGMKSGTIVACPAPRVQATPDSAVIEKCIEGALVEAREQGISGKAVTPFLLGRVSQLSGSASLSINIALLENNARIAAQLARMYADGQSMVEAATSKRCGGSTKLEEHPAPAKAQRKPRVLCIGAAIVDFEVVSNAPDVKSDGGYYPGQIYQRSGGVARNHADGLSRLGVPTSLLTVHGEDPYAEFLKRDAPQIDWSTARSVVSIPTSTSMTISLGGTVTHGFIAVDEAMKHLTPDVISSNEARLSESDWIIIDANLEIASIQRITEMASAMRKRVWFEPTNHLKAGRIIERGAFPSIHALSPNSKEFEVICNSLGLEIPRDVLTQGALRLKEWLEGGDQYLLRELFAHELEILIVTRDCTGSVVAVRKAGEITIDFVAPPSIAPASVVSVSGAGDCFNCGFLSAWMKRKKLDDCITLARQCAQLSLHSIKTVPTSLNECDQST